MTWLVAATIGQGLTAKTWPIHARKDEWLSRLFVNGLAATQLPQGGGYGSGRETLAHQVLI